MSSKGQTAFEMLVTVATLLAFSLPIGLLALSISQLGLEDLSLVHSRTTVQQVSDTINEVYLQGNGAKRTILIDLPSNIRNLTITNQTVNIYLTTNSGPYIITHPILANTTNFTISGAGLHTISVQAIGTKVILR